MHAPFQNGGTLNQCNLAIKQCFPSAKVLNYSSCWDDYSTYASIFFTGNRASKKKTQRSFQSSWWSHDCFFSLAADCLHSCPAKCLTLFEQHRTEVSWDRLYIVHLKESLPRTAPLRWSTSMYKYVLCIYIYIHIYSSNNIFWILLVLFFSNMCLHMCLHAQKYLDIL